MSREIHLSGDLETMGCGTNAAIVAIGAVIFDIRTGELYEKFYCSIDLFDAVRAGATWEQSTVDWWAQQSPEAIKELKNNQISLARALSDFAHWIPPNTKFWGNGSNFDNRILRESYALFGEQAPWHWIADRDMRTIVALAKAMGVLPKVDRVGTHHNALDDAIFQANVISGCFKGLQKGRPK